MRRLGRLFFAISLVAFGIQQFLYGDFIPGRAPAWPVGVPGRLAWAWATGALFIVAGAVIARGARMRLAALSVAVLIGGWAVLRSVPVALVDHGFGGDWTNLGKALALMGGACAIAGLVLVGRVCLGTFLVAAGVQHFLFAKWVATLVPAWIPGGLFWTYFAGVALIAGGLGMLVPRTARAAALASGLMILSWVVLLHVPRATAATADQRRNEWVAVFEALACSGIAFVLAGAPTSAPRRK